MTSWTTIANAPGGNSPTVETFSPQTGSYDQSAPAGANNFYLEGASGDDSTTQSGVFQIASCSPSTPFTLSGKLGGRFSDDSVYVEAIFKTSGDVIVPMGNNYSLLAGDDADVSRNGTYLKTAARGAIDYSSGFKWVETGYSSYPIYKITDEIMIMKNKAFGSDRWSFIITDGSWDFNDLTDNLDIDGLYTEDIISTSGDDSHAGDSLNYPPIAQSELYQYSDHNLIGMNAELRYRLNGGNFNSSFWDVNISGVSPGTAAKVEVRAEFDEENASTCYAYAERLQFVEG